MVVKPHNYLLSTWITKRNVKELLNSISYLVNKVRACNGIDRIVSISVDREKAVTAIEEQLVMELAILLKQPVPYRHEKDIERQVRTMRNRYRCILGELKVPLTRTLKRLAWEHVIKASNFVMNSKSGKFIPYQIQHLENKYRTPPRFGEFIIASVGNVTSKESQRNQVGMIVGFEESTRAVMVKFRGQQQVVIRDSYRAIDQIEGLRLYLDSYRDDDDEIEDDEDTTEVFQVDSDALGDFDVVGEEAEEHPQPEEIEVSEQDDVTESPSDTEDSGIRRSTRVPRPNRLPGFIYALRKNVLGEVKVEETEEPSWRRIEHIHGLVEEAAIQGEQGKRAAAKIELERVWKKYGAIEPVTIDRKQAKEIIKGKLFVVEKKGIYMKLEPYVADIMVEMDPTVQEYLEEDGSMHVRIVKALYGLQESAKLWYVTLGKTLCSIGFQRSNYDHALYYKRVGAELVVILVYVDDMILAGEEQQVLQVKEQLVKVYAITSSELSPKEFDYVGIKVQYDGEDHAFLLSQPGMIHKVTNGITDQAELPCDVKLYQELDGSKLKNVTEYRSKLMELSYLAKTRPDIKVALGYLATKMQEPTIGDEAKLQRVKKYINGTKDFTLRIKSVDTIQVYASADASFGPFMDGKSNTGLAISVGFPNAPVIVKTTKQKTVANSSTAAELIAFSTTLEEVLWIVELLNELGFKQEPVEIEQDNCSTMRLIEKGPSSTGRTKWINIKQFWVSEHLTNETIKLKYVPSLDLLADGLTKPLGRKAFFRWRARILNQRQRNVNE
jgi:hypothetical protein